MSVELGPVKVSVGLGAAVFAACAVNYGGLRLLFVWACSVLAHELTHLLLMTLYGCRRPTVEILPGAVRIRSSDFDALGYRQSAVCLISAPLVNLLTAAVLRIAGRFFPSAVMEQVSFVNLTLGLVNLIPMSFLDGGRALECFLLYEDPARGTERIAFALDAACLIILGAAVVISLCRGIASAALYVFFSYCLVTALKTRRNNFDFRKK